MAEANNIQGAADKISGLLNPKDQQETEIDNLKILARNFFIFF